MIAADGNRVELGRELGAELEGINHQAHRGRRRINVFLLRDVFLQNDILKEYIAQKEYIYPPAPSMRLVIDTFEFGAKFTPKFNTISISGYHIREAGSTALQELAFTIYDGVEYVEWALRRGLNIDEFGPRLSFFFNSHNDFFEEIAKFQAARKVWYRLMKDRFGAKNQRTR